MTEYFVLFQTRSGFCRQIKAFFTSTAFSASFFVGAAVAIIMGARASANIRSCGGFPVRLKLPRPPPVPLHSRLGEHLTQASYSARGLHSKTAAMPQECQGPNKLTNAVHDVCAPHTTPSPCFDGLRTISLGDLPGGENGIHGRCDVLLVVLVFPHHLVHGVRHLRSGVYGQRERGQLVLHGRG